MCNGLIQSEWQNTLTLFSLPQKALFDGCHNMMQPSTTADVKSERDITSLSDFCAACCMFCPIADQEYHLEKRKSVSVMHVPDVWDFLMELLIG